MSLRRSAPAADVPPAETRDLILQAGGEVFAQAGFRAATVRAICQRAGANIAAVNYHFGGKEPLYLEVLRQAYRQSLERHPDDFNVRPTAPPAERLRAFVHGFLLRLLDSGPGAWHWKLTAMEMIEPTPALDTLIAERIQPMAEHVRRIVSDLLGPPADPELVRRCGCSIVGQCLFYRHSQSIIQRLFPEQGFRPDDLEQLAEHITRFSLAAVQHFAQSARPRRGARRSQPAKSARPGRTGFPTAPKTKRPL